MPFMADFQRERRFVRGLNRTLKRVKSIAPDSPNLICDDLQEAVEKWRDRTAMTFEGRTLSYAELDAIANRFAHWGKGINLRRGQTVALFMPNRLEYFPIWKARRYGLSKIGVVTALINNQLSGLALAHCLNISQAACVIVDAETSPVFEAAKEPLLERPLPQWVYGPAHGDQRDLVQALKSCSQLPPDKIVREDIRARDTALLIFTSGTTGLPKAARISHVRAQLYMRGFAGSTDAKAVRDRIYVALPLYHATGGLCALGAALLNGGSGVPAAQVLRQPFLGRGGGRGLHQVRLHRRALPLSGEPGAQRRRGPPQDPHGLRQRPASRHLADHEAKRFQDPGDPGVLRLDRGQRLDVQLRWPRRRHRPRAQVAAQALQRAAWCSSTWRARRRSCGTNGLCIEAGPGQIGECIGQIGGRTRAANIPGYVDKAVLQRKKVLHDVFEEGDAWFATGDLMRTDADGYFYFVDRIGDTFRWKGENVSTNEVAEERLLGCPGVKEANVYGQCRGSGRRGPRRHGRPGGRAWSSTSSGLRRRGGPRTCRSYAQPLFVRILPAIETTGTFKTRKMDLIADGYDPAKFKGPLYRLWSDQFGYPGVHLELQQPANVSDEAVPYRIVGDGQLHIFPLFDECGRTAKCLQPGRRVWTGPERTNQHSELQFRVHAAFLSRATVHSRLRAGRLGILRDRRLRIWSVSDRDHCGSRPSRSGTSRDGHGGGQRKA